MAVIHELDQQTIDQIAAGEVVERPMSVVKELVENAIDAGATAITAEIREGGIALIRVTDNGEGIAPSEVRKAFRPHATSKLSQIDDIYTLQTLGFRGEALSSIAAVSRVEMVSKTKDTLTGIRYRIDGGTEVGLEEVGAPDGTTVIVRDLFYNTPARRKFLKTAQTEGNYIAELMERLALDHPTIAFCFISNRDERFHTSGNGDLQEPVYRIFGREAASLLIPIQAQTEGMSLRGYLGTPALNRSNRNYEIYFVNGRYVRDQIIAKAIEEGYRQYLMQHKFPFAILHLTFAPGLVDVNAHPSKMEVRFHNQSALYAFLSENIAQTLRAHEMIPEALQDGEGRRRDAKAASAAAGEGVRTSEKAAAGDRAKMPESNAAAREGSTMEAHSAAAQEGGVTASEYSAAAPGARPARAVRPPEPFETGRLAEAALAETAAAYEAAPRVLGADEQRREAYDSPVIKKDRQVIVEKNVQLDMFEERLLTKEHRDEYRLLGQIFGTYWILAFRDKMYLIDQHAAHEKVNYERMLKRYHDRAPMSQMLNPPVILTMSAQEEAMYDEYRTYFSDLGFQVEAFGAHTYAMRAVPTELYGSANEKELFLEILDELTSERGEKDPGVVTARLAGMACKASVKGATPMSPQEAQALIDELLTLENPYNCPHGRPTIISMSKYEIDRKFKRIVG